MLSPRVVRSSEGLLASRPLFGTGEDVGRRAKAFAALEGRALKQGLFGGDLENNPWRPALELDESVARQAGAGGVALVLQLSDPIDFIDTERLGLLWDDTVPVGAPIAVREGDRVLVTVPDRRGQRLSAWITDGSVTVTLAEVAPAARAAELRKQEQARRDEDDAAPERALDKLVGALESVGMLGVVVAGVVVFLYLKK